MMRSAFESVSAALREYQGEAISLLVGEPFYGPPAGLVEALSAASESGNRYSPNAGLESFREVLCGIEHARGIDVRPGHIVVGNGSKGLLFGLIALLGREGVITPAPYYPGVAAQTMELSLRLDALPFSTSTSKVSAIRIGDARGGCLVVSSPSNPTGEMYNAEEQRELVAVCRKNGCVLIADEAYIDLVHDGSSVSFAAADPNLEATVLLRSFSKSMGICGWRMGYAVAPESIASMLAEWQSRALNPASTIVQLALEKYLSEHRIACRAYQSHYSEVLNRLRVGLEKLGIHSVKPEGGFYLFCDLKKHSPVDAGQGGGEFCTGLAREAGIGIWPGEDFGVPGWARLSCGRISPGNSDELVSEILGRLGRHLERKGMSR